MTDRLRWHLQVTVSPCWAEGYRRVVVRGVCVETAAGVPSRVVDMPVLASAYTTIPDEDLVNRLLAGLGPRPWVE